MTKTMPFEFTPYLICKVERDCGLTMGDDTRTRITRMDHSVLQIQRRLNAHTRLRAGYTAIEVEPPHDM